MITSIRICINVCYILQDIVKHVVGLLCAIEGTNQCLLPKLFATLRRVHVQFNTVEMAVIISTVNSVVLIDFKIKRDRTITLYTIC